MASIGDVAAALRAAIAIVEGAAGAAKTASDKLETAYIGLVAALEESSNPNAHDGLAQVYAARELIGEVLTTLAAGNATMGTYVVSIAGGKGGGASPSPTATGTSSQRSAEGSAEAGLRHAATVPPLGKRLAERLPIWDEDDPTIAYAYTDEDGAETKFRSGKDATAKAGLKPDYANRWVMDHAEAKTAAAIRTASGAQRVKMVINKEPCQG